MRLLSALLCEFVLGMACLAGLTGTLTAAENPADESGVGGLRLRSLRSADQLRIDLERAGLTPDGLSRLRSLQNLVRDQFLLAEGTSATGGRLVEQWLESAPVELWKRWDASVHTDAERDWQRWQSTRSESALLEFLRNYGPSRLGMAGWKTQARRCMDAAQWDHAVSALHRVLNHRAASPDDRAQAIVELFAVRLRQRRPDVARAFLHEHLATIQDRTVRWAGTTQPAMTVVAEIARISDNSPEQPLPKTSERPSLSVAWQSPISLPNEFQTYWPGWRRDYRAEGAWLNPIAEPLVVANRVIVPTLTGLVALDAASSKEQWRVAHDDWQRILPKLEKTESFENRDWRSHVLDQLVRRESADSILGRITTDGKRVFAVSSGVGTELDRLVPRVGTNAGPRDDAAPPPIENRLSAYDVETGGLLWKLGGTAAGPTYRFSQMFFCGPPCVVDGTLYVVGQQETELQLIALDAVRGEELWSTVIGDVPRSLSADPTRQRTACPVVWDDGMLIITTANGAVVAVDALTHAPRWAYRYPTTPRESLVRPRGENSTFLPDPWWDTWRDVRLFTTPAAILFVSPESQRIHAIHRKTGAPMWTASREDSLWFTGVTDRQAIVAGPYHLAALDLQSGKLVWRTAIPESGGRPLLTATALLQPLQNGDLARLSLSDGVTRRQRGINDFVMGNLVSDTVSWYSISETNIFRWRDPIEAGLHAVSLAEKDPENPAPKLLWARSELEAGDRQRAREKLPAVENPSDEWLRTERQITLMELAEEPSTWKAAVENLPAGALNDEHFPLAEAIITAARQAGDVVDAGRWILRWLEQSTQNETVTTAGVRRHVRIDLACLGMWDDVWTQADASQRAVLAQLQEEAWQRAVKGADPFAVARWLEIWQPMPVARQKAMESDDRHFLGRSLAAIELQLVSLAESTPAPESGRLWRRLADVMTDAGFPRIAAGYRARARSADPTGTDKNETAPVAATAWPTNSPQIDAQKEKNNDVYQITVPLDLDASTWFDHLDVTIDRQYPRVTFTSAEHRGTWELRLPNSNGPMRLFPNVLMSWGRGRVLLLRAGSELFAITPFDERGEPVARILWMTDTLVGAMVLADQSRVEPLPMLPGIREEDQRAVNAFGRTLAQVGPVRAGFVCYQERGKLVSVETMTGRKRWERFDLPFDATCFGDDERVLVWSPSRQQVEVLRAIDGQWMDQRAWTADPDRTLLLHDTRAYRMVSQPNGWQLLCEDVATGREIWKHAAPAGSSPVVLDRDTLGIAESAGRLRFFSTHDGRELGEPVSFPPMPQFERAIVSRDVDTWFVVVSNRVSRQAAFQSPNQRNSHRTPPVDGPLIAIDRHTYQPRWRIPLSRVPWPLDQPRTAPLLAYSYKLGTPDQVANGVTSGILRILDKRSGMEVVQRDAQSMLGYATFQTNPDRGLIEVRMENETLRLRYLPHPPAPSPPEP